jgi:hypothetical protein
MAVEFGVDTSKFTGRALKYIEAAKNATQQQKQEYYKYLGVERNAPENKEISRDVQEGIRQEVSGPTDAEERAAIQSEKDAEEIGDFLDGLVEDTTPKPSPVDTHKKDLFGRPIAQGGASGPQKEFLNKEDFLVPKKDVEGQKTFLPPKGSKEAGFVNLEGVAETAQKVVEVSKKMARRLGLTGKIKDIPKAPVKAAEIIGQAVSYGTAPISYRLEQISPKLSQGIRRHAFDVIMNTHRIIQRLSGLFKTQSVLHSMTAQDEDAFYEALFSRNMTEAGNIANRNGFGKDFREALRYLDSAYQRALDNGV